MAQKGNLMTVRQDVRVVDATLRDGGLVNDFHFTDEFVNALYRTNVTAVSGEIQLNFLSKQGFFRPAQPSGASAAALLPPTAALSSRQSPPVFRKSCLCPATLFSAIMGLSYRKEAFP